MMNHIKISSISLIVFLFLNSCLSIQKKINGEKKIQKETTISVEDFAKEQNLNIDFNKNLYLKHRFSNALFSSFRPYNSPEKISFPDVYIFDKNLFLIDDDNVCYVNKVTTPNTDYYKNNLSDNYKLFNNSKSLKNLDNSFVDKNGKTIFPFKENFKEDYLAIVLWSKYKGKMWANETNFIIQELQKSSVSFNIYFLNMDDIVFDKRE